MLGVLFVVWKCITIALTVISLLILFGIGGRLGSQLFPIALFLICLWPIAILCGILYVIGVVLFAIFSIGVRSYKGMGW